MKCLGIDIGSSSIKGSVLDLESGLLEQMVRKPFPEPVTGLPAGHFEIDPRSVVTAVRGVLEELVHREPTATDIFFSGQMGGVLLVEQNGTPVTNYLSWRDQRTIAHQPRGQSYLHEIRERLTEEDLIEIGLELKPGAATTLLFWLAANGQLPAGTCPLSLGDFVVSQLCGTTPCTEPTQALGTLNVKGGDWHFRSFERLGFGELIWPRLQSYDLPCGTVRIGTSELACHPVVGDHQCSLLGIGLRETELSINISTGSQVSRLTREWTPGSYQTRPYFGGLFLNTLTHLPAGRSLVVLVDLLTELSRREGGSISDPWRYIAEAVAETPASELQVDLAFFAGPLGNGQGSIQNITTENLTVGSLFRAAFQNMAANYRTCADRLGACGAWSQLVMSGGLSQKMPVLRQLILEQFDNPHRECPEGEDALLGLLELARRTLCADCPPIR